MSYNNHLIEAVLDLGLADKSKFYGINTELTEIYQSDDDSIVIPVTDAVISRAKYLYKKHEIRTLRNNMIKDTDWIVLSDVDMNDAEKQIWLDYRQSLRDCTGELIEGQEDEFEFPTSPLASNT